MSWLLFSKNENDYQVDVGVKQHIVSNSQFVIRYDEQERFSGDSGIYQSGDIIKFINGVILNLQELLTEHETLIQFLNSERFFPDAFRGPFTGFMCDSSSATVFPNQTGDTAVFYYCDGGKFVSSNDFNEIYRYLKKCKIKLSYNEQAARHLLSFGWIIDGHTLANEIKRVKPGRLVKFFNGSVEESAYHLFDNTPVEMTLDEAIEKVDTGFRKAVDRCFRKDLEYGYDHHLADMSGGYDSRMVSWVARDLGYDNITNITYAKTGSKEVEYAMQVSFALENEILYRPLDDLLFIYDIDEMIRENWGSAFYSGMTGGRRLLNSLNFSRYGLEHTGQIGDVVIGSFIKNIEDQSVHPELICSSDVIEPMGIIDDYKNHEIFAMYNRGFYGVLSTHFIRAQRTFAVSPFIDADFLDTCLSIPLKYRVGHLLYRSWMATKYPKSLEIPSTRSEQKNDHKIRHLIGKIAGKYKKQLVKIYKQRQVATASKSAMNPYDYWYETNPRFKRFINDYYSSNIGIMNSVPETQQLVLRVFKDGNCRDKIIALTVIAGYKEYFEGAFYES